MAITKTSDIKIYIDGIPVYKLEDVNLEITRKEVKTYNQIDEYTHSVFSDYSLSLTGKINNVYLHSP